MKKRGKIIIGVVLALVLTAGALVFKTATDMMKNLAALENATIDMAQVADGVYTGSSDAGLVQAEVQVTVKDHKIVSIDLLRHQNGLGTPAEATLDDMIAQNTDDVDAVSGATASCKTIRNAVNKALLQGLAVR